MPAPTLGWQWEEPAPHLLPLPEQGDRVQGFYAGEWLSAFAIAVWRCWSQFRGAEWGFPQTLPRSPASSAASCCPLPTRNGQTDVPTNEPRHSSSGGASAYSDGRDQRP